MSRKPVPVDNPCRERRGFFRIQDDLVLTYHQVPRKVYEALNDKRSNSTLSAFNLKARFVALDRALRPVVNRLREQSPDLAQYMEAMDEKLDMLAEVVFRQEVDLDDLPSQEVNLSAGGLSFQAQKCLNPGSILQVRLLLQPSGVGIESYARVVYCRPTSNQSSLRFPWRVGVEFLHLREEDSDLIARHVLCREADLRRRSETTDDKTELSG